MSEQTTKDSVILFADVTGSVTLYEKLGDEKAHKLIIESINLISQAVQGNRGRVLQTIGDEVMADFDTCDDACEAAIQIQRNIQPYATEIRCGFNFGPVIYENGNVYGDTVNLAARVASIATANEVVITEMVERRLHGEHKSKVRFLDTRTVKGRAAEVSLFQVTWLEADDEEELTFMPTASGTSLESASSKRLVLQYSGERFFLTPEDRSLTVGRHPENDLTVSQDHRLTSKRHGKFYWMNGRFYFSDNSSNGTFIASKGTAVRHVKRDNAELDGVGSVGLGCDPATQSSGVIHYHVENI